MPPLVFPPGQVCQARPAKNHLNKFDSSAMSRMPKPNSKNNIPTPPPLPPPLKSSSASNQARRKNPGSTTKRHSDGAVSNSRKQGGTGSPSHGLPNSASPTNQRRGPNSGRGSGGDIGGSGVSQRQEPAKPTKRNYNKGEFDPDCDPDINDVIFFNEEECIDPADQFSFPCCVPPYSPRYPPNPRPKRKWDPSVLPAGTNIPESIGACCRRCGKEVFLAELHLSSRGAYHTECFKCCLCGKSLDSWSVAEYKGEVFCKGCYRRNFGAHGTGFGVGAGALQTP